MRRDDQVVVLAGGLGTRMRPYTETLPKFLLPVAGRPFGAWLLERLAASGFAEALLCVGHLGRSIAAAIGDGSAFGITVRYAYEDDRLLGTGGALRAAFDSLEETFLVTYGDSYLPFDYLRPLRDLREHDDALGTMAVFKNRDQWDTSNAEVRGDVVARYEKRPPGAPRDEALEFIDYGATALRRTVVSRLVEGAPAGLDALQAELAIEGKLRAFVADQRFFEIGSEAGRQELERELRAAGGPP